MTGSGGSYCDEATHDFIRQCHRNDRQPLAVWQGLRLLNWQALGREDLCTDLALP